MTSERTKRRRLNKSVNEIMAECYNGGKQSGCNSYQFHEAVSNPCNGPHEGSKVRCINKRPTGMGLLKPRISRVKPTATPNSDPRCGNEEPRCSQQFDDRPFCHSLPENNYSPLLARKFLSDQDKDRSKYYVVGDDLMKKLIRSVEELNEEVKILTSFVYSSLGKSDDDDDAGLPENMTLPASSLDAMDELQEQLKSSSVQEKLVNQLRDIGGRTLDEFVRRTMVTVMTNDVALQYTVHGTIHKKSFSTTILFELLYRAAKKNRSTVFISKKDLEQSLAKWFVGARDRTGGNRIKRGRNEEQEPQQ